MFKIQNILNKSTIFFKRIFIKSLTFLNKQPTLNVRGRAVLNQILVLKGYGMIRFNNTIIGYDPSPFRFSSNCYLEARNKSAEIIFGSNIVVNNGLTIICDKTKIEIMDDVLIGTNVEIYDSDFHEINPKRRNQGGHNVSPVMICRNVFIGSNAKILKGVEIGENSIIANSAVVVKNVPSNVIVGGNPARIIKHI